MPKPYNGHRSWNAWNVALYIANDASYYHLAVEALRTTHTLDEATTKFIRFTGCLGEKTADGATYNRLAIKLALEGLEIEQLKKGE